MRIDRGILHRPTGNHRPHHPRAVSEGNLLRFPVHRRGQTVQRQRKRPPSRRIRPAQHQTLLHPRQRPGQAHIRRPPHPRIDGRRPVDRGRSRTRTGNPERHRRTVAHLHRRQPRIICPIRDVRGVLHRRHPMPPRTCRHQTRINIDQRPAGTGEPLRHRIHLGGVGAVGIEVLVAPHRPPPRHLHLPRLHTAHRRRNRRGHRGRRTEPRHPRRRIRFRHIHRPRRLRRRTRHRTGHRRHRRTHLRRRRRPPRLRLPRRHLRRTARRAPGRALRQRRIPERIYQRRRPAHPAPGHPQHRQRGHHQHGHQPERDDRQPPP